MRKRIKSNRVYSSDDYKSTIKSAIVQTSESTLLRKRRYYVSCFDKLIEITETEAIRIEKTVKIIIK